MIQLRGPSVAAALLADALYGEPPEGVHPTCLMGRAVLVFEGRALALKGTRRERLAGLFLALILPAISFVLARGALRLAPHGLRRPFEVALLSTALSMRGLGRAALAVERELESGDLVAARACVGRFVGRDTAHLSANEAARAAVESVAENTSDGVVAPMLYGLLFGAPGALAYRAINTVDSMVGYTSPRYRHLGWAGARLDDLANLAPARLTVLAVAGASLSPARVLRAARLYGPLSSSPNAGYAEAAFAGALGLRLGGTNTYGGVERRGAVLGEGRPPGVDDIGRAVALMRRACVGVSLAALLLEGVRRG